MALNSATSGFAVGETTAGLALFAIAVATKFWLALAVFPVLLFLTVTST